MLCVPIRLLVFREGRKGIDFPNRYCSAVHARQTDRPPQQRTGAAASGFGIIMIPIAFVPLRSAALKLHRKKRTRRSLRRNETAVGDAVRDAPF